MADFLWCNCFSFACLLFLNMLLIINAVSAGSNNYVELVCSEDTDQAFCRSILTSDPRSQNANFTGLANIAITYASQSANATAAKIQSLSRLEKDPRRKANFAACAIYYEKAIDSLTAAPGDLESGQYLLLNLDGGRVNGEAISCENMFKSRSPLTRENYLLAQLGEIIVIISDKLDPSGA
ncbi:hypothetical protein ACP275_09G047600 [Erythranthe tilingii]